MTWKTHLIGGAQAGVLAACLTSEDAVGAGIVITSALLGSVMPDIDQPGSKLAKSDSLVGLMSHAISIFTGHRGITHTLPGAAIIAALFYLLAMFKTEKESVLAFFLAISAFVILHAAGSVFRRLAGYFAVLIYLAGPKIAELLTEHDISIAVNERSAILCASGVFLGCVSHMLYDTFNKGGIMWLWPFTRHDFSVLSIRTDSIGEFWFAAVQVVLLALVLSLCFREILEFQTLGGVIEMLREMEGLWRTW